MNLNTFLPKLLKLSFLLILLFLIFYVFAGTASAQAVPNFDCESNFSELAEGIHYKQFSVSSPRSIKFYVVKTEIGSGIDLMVTPKDSLGLTPSQFAKKFGAVLAINGDLHYKSPSWQTLGLAAAEGDVYFPASAEPSVFSQDNQVKFFSKFSGQIGDAISGSNRLIEGGKISLKLMPAKITITVTLIGLVLQ